jgi:hypothetical protein
LEIKNQLDRSWPIELDIFPASPGSGHAVVLDGYRRELGQYLVTVNYGWGGNLRYYYPVDSIGPYLVNSAYINIYPEDLAHVGAIAGDITLLVNKSNTPISEATVTLFRQEMDSRNPYYLPDLKMVHASSNGRYELSAIKPGAYKVEFNAGNEWRWYKNKASLEEADLVLVQEGIITEDINPICFAVQIRGSRREAQAWAIRKTYGNISIQLTNQAYFPQLQMALQRKINDDEFVPIKTFSASELQQDGIVYLDTYLDRDKRNTYRIEARTHPDGDIVYSNELAL